MLIESSIRKSREGRGFNPHPVHFLLSFYGCKKWCYLTPYIKDLIYPINMTTLYASKYTDDNHIRMTIFQGIYEKKSTNSNKVYPAVIHFGNVSITQRCFYKGAKFPQKILSHEGDILTLTGYNRTCKQLSIVLTELGYDETMLTDITNIINSASADKKIKTYERWRHNEYGTIDGIVNF